MKKPIISQIAAMDRKRAIGSANNLPWHMPTDMNYFRDKTRRKPVIMGRKTFETLGKPLPGRPNIIISRNKNFSAKGASVFQNLQDALSFARTLPEGSEEIFVIGGAEIYRLALPDTDRIYLTLIDTEVPAADAYFPVFDMGEFKLVGQDPRKKDAENPYDYIFQVFERIRD